MRIRWRGLELPSRVERDETVSTDTYGRFIVEPFERGFGTTVGNSLRRILLSSLEGAAITRVKIAEAPHEFTSIPGILEDATDVILNTKSIVVRWDADDDDPKQMKVSRSESGEVRAGDIEAEAGIEVVNPDLLICTLTSDDASFNMEMTVHKGRGYASAEENRGADEELGVIPVDSVFSPVMRVRYRTEDTRVGQRTNYDRLIMEVWTRGTLKPQEALVEASKILRKHLNPFVMYEGLGTEVVTGPAAVPQPEQPAIDSELARKWDQPISVLNLSVRASNCLESARLNTVGDVASKTEGELLRLRAFGKTSLREVRRKLAEYGLSLGMGGPHSTPTGTQDNPEENVSVPVEQNH